LVAERFICLCLDADRQFVRSGGAQHEDVGIPSLTIETVERNDALRICFGDHHLAGREEALQEEHQLFSLGGAGLGILNQDLASSFALL
jgi:hypothetical protein